MPKPTPAPSELQLTIRTRTIRDTEILELLWTNRLGATRSTIHQLLASVIEDVHGVERVHMFAYSATIEVAHHVASMQSIKQSITEALLSQGIPQRLEGLGIVRCFIKDGDKGAA